MIVFVVREHPGLHREPTVMIRRSRATDAHVGAISWLPSVNYGTMIMAGAGITGIYLVMIGSPLLAALVVVGGLVGGQYVDR